MDSVIVSDYGVMLAKKGDRLVVRGPKPRLELIEGGPQLFLPLGTTASALRSPSSLLKVRKVRLHRSAAPLPAPTASTT